MGAFGRAGLAPQRNREARAGEAKSPVIGRFAPSPTGRMHAGNVFSSLMAWLVAKSQGGKVVLRIEDIDVERSKPEYAEQVQRDLEVLGLTWDVGPYYQSARTEAYREAYRVLEQRGLVYPCFCTRADLHAASAPHRGEKLVYPGTCRDLTAEQRQSKGRHRSAASRLQVPSRRYAFRDLVQGDYAQDLAAECGDFVVRRSDGLFAYQLAVVVDDAAQHVNSVVRGMDLLVSTPQQLYLQDLLGLPHPVYAHVPLVVGQRDRRLSKRDRDASLDELMARYRSPAAIIGHIAAIAGLSPVDEPMTCEELLANFDVGGLGDLFEDRIQIQWR